jgi:hypothetical protein
MVERRLRVGLMAERGPRKLGSIVKSGKEMDQPLRSPMRRLLEAEPGLGKAKPGACLA